MSDIKQHPLWREHHGSMEGWGYLDDDERRSIVRTDEFWCFNHWEPTSDIGDVTIFGDGLTYRRRIAPATEATKRFVTVVYEVKPPYENFVTPHNEHVKLMSYREGNYLEKFDGMKERVVNAMEGN